MAAADHLLDRAIHPLLRACSAWLSSLTTRRPSPRSRCGSAVCSAHNAPALADLLRALLPPAVASAASDHPRKPALPPVAARFPPADRIVAIGDVHGDVDALRTALRSARVLDDRDAWAGGNTVLVQVGDVLDRGNHERAIYRLLFSLQDSAPLSGGAVHILLGNHEIMNARLDFRYVTRAGFDEFRGARPRMQFAPALVNAIRSLAPFKRPRAVAMSPGGSLAAQLALRARLAVIVGDNVFVHAGLRKDHLTDAVHSRKGPDHALNMLNERTSTFLMGMASLPTALRGGTSPIWMRDYSRPPVLDPRSDVCSMLAETLNFLRAKRMIVGHTPQLQGINSVCAGQVWRIDTGMSAVYGGIPEAFEINRHGKVQIYTPDGVIDGCKRFN